MVIMNCNFDFLEIAIFIQHDWTQMSLWNVTYDEWFLVSQIDEKLSAFSYGTRRWDFPLVFTEPEFERVVESPAPSSMLIGITLFGFQSPSSSHDPTMHMISPGAVADSTRKDH